MGIRGRFGKKQEKARAEDAGLLDELRKVCGNDDETYEALYRVMFLDPRKIQMRTNEAADTAERFEEENNLGRARVWYDIAGGLAIYEGDTEKVAEFFGKAEKISGLKYPIVKNPEKAVAKAQEYYKNYLKTIA